MCLRRTWFNPITKQVTFLYLTMLSNGITLGVTGAMLTALQAQNSTLRLDLESASWLSGVAGLGMMLLSVGVSPIMATLGRRGALLVGISFGIVGSFIMYFAMDITLLIIGRFLGGACMGMTGLVGAIIIGEYTTPEYRGVFLNLKCAMQFVGGLVAHVMGQYIDWRTLSLTISVPYMLNIIAVCTWPESPSWLASQKRFDESTAAFHWLRGKSEQTTRELNAMIATQKEIDFYRDKTIRKKVVIFLKKFRQKNFLKPLGIYLFAALLLDASGRHIFPAYALQIIQEMNGDGSNSYFYTICIDLLTSISCISSIVFVKYMKRRTVLFSSGAASVIVLLAVSLYYYLQSKLLISDDWNAICLVLFGSYFVFVNLGCTPISLTLIGELFPLEHRSIGSSISSGLIGLFMLLTLKITPVMLASIKVYGTFAAYGVTMTVCLVVLYLYLPETKDKSLPEIEKYFNDKNSVINEEDEGISLQRNRVSNISA